MDKPRFRIENAITKKEVGRLEIIAVNTIKEDYSKLDEDRSHCNSRCGRYTPPCGCQGYGNCPCRGECMCYRD